MSDKNLQKHRIVMEITETDTIQKDLEKRNRELTVLYELGRATLRCGTLQQVVDAALNALWTVIDADFALYYQLEGDWLMLKGWLPEDAASLNEKKRVGTCLCGLAAQTGEAVFSVDIAADIRCTLNECKEAGVRSFAALPICNDHEISGVVGLASKTERDFSRHREFLGAIAATIAAASRNAVLLEQLQRHAEEMETRVKERTAELEAKNAELDRFNRLFVDREFRIKELKERVKELERNPHHCAGRHDTEA